MERANTLKSLRSVRKLYPGGVPLALIKPKSTEKLPPAVVLVVKKFWKRDQDCFLTERGELLRAIIEKGLKQTVDLVRVVGVEQDDYDFCPEWIDQNGREILIVTFGGRLKSVPARARIVSTVGLDQLLDGSDKKKEFWSQLKVAMQELEF